MRLAAAFGLAAALALFPATASAAVITVPCSSENNSNDPPERRSRSECRFRPDTIELAQGCTYTFFQGAFQNGGWFGSNALPAIASEITIEGNGATLSRQDSVFGTFRYFFVGADPTRPETLDYVTPGAGNLTIRDLTLKDGKARGGSAFGGGGGAGLGGAIFNMGTTRIERSTLTGNSALGGAGDGTLGGDSYPAAVSPSLGTRGMAAAWGRLRPVRRVGWRGRRRPRRRRGWSRLQSG